MWKYICAHWQGEHSITRSCLLNGVIVPLFMHFCGIVIVGLFIVCSIAISSRPPNPIIFHYAQFCLFLIWAIWASVGVIRCGWRNLRVRPIGGVAAMTWGLLIAAYAVLTCVFV